MKKTPLLNAALSELVASLGHMDMVVIGDAGLPIPAETRCIDLALTRGIPAFADTLRVVVEEMQVESAFIAAETAQNSPRILAEITDLLPMAAIQMISHEELKEKTRQARAVVRTGEFTPYANIILVSGVVF